MPISQTFEHIPANWRMPLYWVEVDPSKAGLPVSNLRILLVGTMLTTGVTGTAGVPTAVATQAQADDKFGEGSELAMMFKACFANNFAQEVWGVGLAEPGGGVAATFTITVSAVPTAPGTLHIYIAGIDVPVSFNATETTTTAATAIKNAINANINLPVTANSAAGVVTCTCKWKGVSGNDIDVRDSYLGTLGGQEKPLGLTIAYTQPTNGTAVPVMTSVITNLGETEFEYVALPYTDDPTLDLWEAEYGFSDTGRWGFIRQHYGHILSCARDTLANLQTLGVSRN